MILFPDAGSQIGDPQAGLFPQLAETRRSIVFPRFDTAAGRDPKDASGLTRLDARLVDAVVFDLEEQHAVALIDDEQADGWSFAHGGVILLTVERRPMLWRPVDVVKRRTIPGCASKFCGGEWRGR
jgi:hypothetical protein